MVKASALSSMWFVNTVFHFNIKSQIFIDCSMKKIAISVALAAVLCTSMSSCMGKFALTRNLYAWNEQISNKFINEIVFVAFWILPVYEVCGIADLIVLNSIEFWSGDNPITASSKTIDTDHGHYLVECDGKGYDITLQETGEKYRLNFSMDNQTWSLQLDGKEYPIMTFIDAYHVKVPSGDGHWQTVELSQNGLLAYKAAVAPAMMAYK